MPSAIVVNSASNNRRSRTEVVTVGLRSVAGVALKIHLRARLIYTVDQDHVRSVGVLACQVSLRNERLDVHSHPHICRRRGWRRGRGPANLQTGSLVDWYLDVEHSPGEADRTESGNRTVTH